LFDCDAGNRFFAFSVIPTALFIWEGSRPNANNHFSEPGCDLIALISGPLLKSFGDPILNSASAFVDAGLPWFPSLPPLQSGNNPSASPLVSAG